MRLVGPNCFGVAVPAARPGRDVRRRAPQAGRRRTGGPVRRHRRLAARAPVRARYRRVVVRVGRRQVRRVEQRHADVVGAGRADQAGRAVRGVVRQPAEVRPDRAPGRPADAGADRHRRPVRRGPAGRRLAHRGRGHAPGHPGGAVRPGRHHRAARPWRTGRGRRAAGLPAAARRRPGRDRVQRGRGGRARRRRLRRQRAARGGPVRGHTAPAGQAAAGRRGGRGAGRHDRRRRP